MYAYYEKKAHWDIFFKHIPIPGEALAYLTAARQAIEANDGVRDAFEMLVVELMFEPQTRIEEALKKAAMMAQPLGYHAYTLEFILLVEAGFYLRMQYEKRGISEDIFWDTMRDLRYKLLECWNTYHIWGIFVGWWYKKILSCDIFALGRFQYERSLFAQRETYTRAGLRVEWGAPVLSIHIPSSGPMREAERMDSYRRAFAFFSHDGQPIVCVCDSWLLFKEHVLFLPPQSNILAFMNDFDIIASHRDANPREYWRIFGADAATAPAQWPEDTSLRRAYKQRVLAGESTGSGYGVLIFDGEKIVR